MSVIPLSSSLAAMQSTGTVFRSSDSKSGTSTVPKSRVSLISSLSHIKSYGSLAKVQTMAANQAKKNGTGTDAAGLLDVGMYSYSVMSGVGAASAMMFSDTWTAGTKSSGTMLDYYA